MSEQNVATPQEKQPSPSERGLTRHGKHRIDRYYFATWFDLEFFAKLRRLSRMQNQSIAETIRNNLSVVNNVQLSDTDRLWMSEQMTKREGKRF